MLSRVFFRHSCKYAFKFFPIHRTIHLHSTEDFTLEAYQLETANDAAWAKSEEGQSFLKELLLTSKSTSSSHDMKSYLQKRRVCSENSAAARFLSSLTTFPLTLSYGIDKIFHAQRPEISILIVGARSEEALTSSASLARLSINMIGPGLQTHKYPKTPMSVDSAERRVLLNHVDEGKTLLHDHKNNFDLLRQADMFVLYNPGFGCSHLRHDWAPTLQLLLETRKPVLATAHSLHDLRRDIDALGAISLEEDYQDLGEPVEMIFSPHTNPFQSFKRTFDPKEEPNAQVVTTNEFVYAFQAK